MFHVTIFHANGSKGEFCQSTAPRLELLWNAVRGHIELVPYWDEYDGRRCVAYVNDVGKLQGLPINNRATWDWHMSIGRQVDDYLVGHVIVIGVDTDDEFAEL